MNPKITCFNEKEKTAMAINLAKGRELLKQFAVQPNTTADAKLLDEIFSQWANNKQNDFSREDIANGLGSLFGELLKNDFGCAWQMIEDRYGSEPAVIHELTGSIVFPINAVWKRIEPELDDKPFFLPMWQAFKEHLARQQ
ncbi:MAG: DUF3806 domain-containing protein [Erysipelotrichia bacterium]|nr:DUF3806 domain-containing protein [Erysipelotrichia bacterium]